MTQNFGAPSKKETRSLRVSVWFAFAPAVAEVTVTRDGTEVKIGQAWLEPKNAQGRLGLDAEDLDRIGIFRAAGPTTLREAFELRAREEAFS
jgi:hypothetical protein